MLDALTLTVNRPMYLSLTERKRAGAREHDVRLVIEPSAIGSAFHEADRLARDRPSFLRSLGWYRKGLTNDDPLDKFLAFWNAIEIVASKFYHYVPSIDKERAKQGSKSQVWECFKALWGECKKWPVIPGLDKWIDESYSVRKDVAHGVTFIDIHKVSAVAKRLPVIQEVCYHFLRGWHENFLGLNQPSPSVPTSEADEELSPPE
jgi:hypothetical protein